MSRHHPLSVRSHRWRAAGLVLAGLTAGGLSAGLIAMPATASAQPAAPTASAQRAAPAAAFPGGPVGVPGAPGPAGDPAAHMDHVFVIMMENHSYQQILDPSNPNTGYIRQLASQYALATSYYGVTHDSMPNYIAALEGSTWNASQDDTTGESSYFNHTNLVDELEAAHLSWKAYAESLPYAGYTGPSNAYSGQGGMYDREHNPFAYIPDIASNPQRAQNIVPLTQLSTDLADNRVPDYAWITPNVCDDMHGGATECPGAAGTAPPTDPNQARLETDGNDFLKTWVTRIMSSRAWTGNSTIFVVWDENNYTTLSGCCDSPLQPQPPVSFTQNSNGTLGTNGGDLAGSQLLGGGHVPMIVISRRGPRGVTDNTPFNHYSLLQTIEANWNLPYLGYASDTLNVKPLTPLLAPAGHGQHD